MNYQQAYQPQPPNPQPANYRNPNQESPVIKYILIAGAVLLALLIIATAVIFILSRTYSDEDSKDDETSETEEETDTDKPPETDTPGNALKTSLIDAGLYCEYGDRGFVINLFLGGGVEEVDEETGQTIKTFDPNDYKTLTDTFKGPVFLCTEIEDVDQGHFQITTEDFRVLQEVIFEAVFKEGPGVKEACATDPTQIEQAFEEGSKGLFSNAAAIEGWTFISGGEGSLLIDPLKNRLGKAGIPTKNSEVVKICDVLNKLT